MYIDTHCHLTDARYEDSDSLVLQSLRNGIDTLICIGYDITSSEKSKDISERFEEVYFTAGVHPDTAKSYNGDTDNKIRELAKHDKCVAIGEIGLDYHYDGYDRKAQKDCFTAQIEIANQYKLPLSVHSRDACKDTLDIIKSVDGGAGKGVMHCYSYSKEVAKEYLDMGYYLSFGGTLTYKNSLNVKEVCKYAPLDRILTETDCPYLPPRLFRGQTNYPYYVSYVLEEIALLKNVSLEEVSKAVKENAKRLFYKLK